MTALCEMATVEQVRIHIKSKETFSLNVQADLMELQLFSRTQGLLGVIKDLVFAKWNDGAFPTEPGEYEGLVFVENPVRLFHSGRWLDCDVFARLTVGQTRFFGELSAGQVAMLRGEGPAVEMPEIESEWRRLAADETVDAEITFEGVTPY